MRKIILASMAAAAFSLAACSEKAQQEMEQSGHVGTAAFRGWLIDEVSQSENMA